MSESSVRISFGIIVLNGEPYTKYCIRSLYSHAHEIIISEGACEGARSIACADGHSRDGTLELLKAIKKEEDPDNKITIVTAESEGHPDGFWPGEKHEQCRAFAKRATGDYLWQVDIDEFYLETDIARIKSILSADSTITCISFKQFSFWGGFDYLVDSWYFKRHLPEIYRVFKWGPGYEYTTHRPPTVIDNHGTDLKSISFLKARDTEKLGFYMYHYSFVFPKQVREKAQYYKNADWSKRQEAENWATDVFIKLSKPYRVFSISWIPSWLIPFKKTHPEIICQMIDDINSGELNIEIRETKDLKLLVNSFRYRAGITLLKISEPFDMGYHLFKSRLKSVVRKLKNQM